MFILNFLSKLFIRGLLIDADNGSLHMVDIFLNLLLLDLLLLEPEVALALLLGLGPPEPLVQRYSLPRARLGEQELGHLLPLGVVSDYARRVGLLELVVHPLDVDVLALQLVQGLLVGLVRLLGDGLALVAHGGEWLPVPHWELGGVRLA